MSRKQNKAFVIFAVLLIAFVGIMYWQGWVKPVDSAQFMRWEPGSYAVKQFVDGDTVLVDMNGTEEKIRFIGIDTPETHKENTPVQCYGPAAAAYTKNRIGTQRIRLVADSLTTNRDRYQRLLRYVYLVDGSNLNLELVQKGYAFAYAFPFAKSQEFHSAMEQAQQAKTGLWGNCSPTQLSTGQWQSSDE
ncbi:thermonuclease family protein [Candidatus Saccharibacteria bacterium]|nr:MAG: thermonuclease family protein [Candidatus Saccharibacteria bacterium]